MHDAVESASNTNSLPSSPNIYFPKLAKPPILLPLAFFAKPNKPLKSSAKPFINCLNPVLGNLSRGFTLDGDPNITSYNIPPNMSPPMPPRIPRASAPAGPARLPNNPPKNPSNAPPTAMNAALPTGRPNKNTSSKNPINYKLNNYGFRTNDNLEKKEGNVFLGCSFTFGEGHHLENTWSYKLHKKIGGGLKFWNLSMGGTGIDFAFRMLYSYKNLIDVKNVFLFIPFPLSDIVYVFFLRYIDIFT